jgi:putative ABC transport system substrate-binding protein
LALEPSHTVPVVFVTVIDPAGAGLLKVYRGQAGNGFTLFEYGMSSKWLELLKEIEPDVKRVAVLRDAAIGSGTGQLAALQAVAPSLGVELSPVGVRNAGEIERALATFAHVSSGRIGLPWIDTQLVPVVPQTPKGN